RRWHGVDAPRDTFLLDKGLGACEGRLPVNPRGSVGVGDGLAGVEDAQVPEPHAFEGGPGARDGRDGLHTDVVGGLVDTVGATADGDPPDVEVDVVPDLCGVDLEAVPGTVEVWC